MKAVLVFLLTAGLDFLWASYIQATARGQAVRAGLYSAAIVAASGVTTLVFVTEPIYLIPMCLGAYVGTRLTV